MITSLGIIFICGLFVAGCTTTYLNLKENSTAQIEEKINNYEKDKNIGAEITLSLKNETEVYGELLSVRDSTMIICTQYSTTEAELANLSYPITAFRNDEIQELTIEGSSYIAEGFWIGIFAGTGIGYAIAKAINEMGGVIILIGGTIVGIVVGPIVGYLLSTDDVILREIPPSYDMSLLKPLSRYPDEEPEYLKAIE